MSGAGMSALVQAATSGAVEARVIKLVARHLTLPRGEVTADADFHDDLGCDSIDMVSIAMAAEDEFGVEIGDGEAADCATVGAMARALCAKMGIAA